MSCLSLFMSSSLLITQQRHLCLLPLDWFPQNYVTSPFSTLHLPLSFQLDIKHWWSLMRPDLNQNFDTSEFSLLNIWCRNFLTGVRTKTFKQYSALPLSDYSLWVLLKSFFLSVVFSYWLINSTAYQTLITSGSWYQIFTVTFFVLLCFVLYLFQMSLSLSQLKIRGRDGKSKQTEALSQSKRL